MGLANVSPRLQIHRTFCLLKNKHVVSNIMLSVVVCNLQKYTDKLHGAKSDTTNIYQVVSTAFLDNIICFAGLFFVQTL